MKFSALILPALLSASIAFGSDSGTETPPQAPPFSAWQRLSNKPVLTPQGDGFESAGVFNPTVIKKDGRFQMIYRAQDGKGISRLLFATSSDGVRFTRQTDLALGPEQAYESAGMEDPRVVEVEGTYYLTYTGYDGSNAQLCLAVSNDLAHWERKGIILPAGQGKWNVHWTKSGVILPQKINGKYWMYYLGDPKGSSDEMGVASSEDALHWTDALDHPILSRRPGLFDSRVVEPGALLQIDERGIWLVYNGADDGLAYSTGWVLFDRNDPTRVLARAETPVFRPQLSWETAGQVPNVVFVEGIVRDGGRWLFYYGGADKYIGVASASAR